MSLFRNYTKRWAIFDLARVMGWFLGFVVFFNPYLIPSRTQGSPKLTDGIALILAMVLFLRLLTGYRYGLKFPIIMRVAFALVVLWIGREWLVSGTLTSTDSVRWLLAIPYAYAIYRFMSRSTTRYATAIGMCCGVVGNLGVIGLQSAGFSDLAVQLGLASGRWSDTWVRGADEALLRPTGMWGHPNASAGVVALCFPIVCGLIDEKRFKPYWIAGAWLVVFCSSALTYTRSGIVVSTIVFVVWTARSVRAADYARSKLAILGVAIAALFVLGPPGGWWRWLNEANLSQNSSGRFESTLAALELACRNPLGMGADYQQQLSSMTGFVATHNAWLYLALVGGLPLALCLLVGVIRRLAVLASSSTIEGWLALSITGLFLFEEFFRVPVFVVVTLWLAVRPVRSKAPAPQPLLLPKAGLEGST